MPRSGRLYLCMGRGLGLRAVSKLDTINGKPSLYLCMGRELGLRVSCLGGFWREYINDIFKRPRPCFLEGVRIDV